MEHTLALISLLVLLVVALAGYLLIKVPGSNKLKFLMIPLILFVGVFLGNKIPDLMGRPYPGQPISEFMYVAHTSDNKTTQLWATNKQGDARLYEFPYSEDVDAQLNQMKESAQRGRPMTGQFKKSKLKVGNNQQGKKGSSNNKVGDMDLEIYNIPVDQILPPKQ